MKNKGTSEQRDKINLCHAPNNQSPELTRKRLGGRSTCRSISVLGLLHRVVLSPWPLTLRVHAPGARSTVECNESI